MADKSAQLSATNRRIFLISVVGVLLIVVAGAGAMLLEFQMPIDRRLALAVPLLAAGVAILYVWWRVRALARELVEAGTAAQLVKAQFEAAARQSIDAFCTLTAVYDAGQQVVDFSVSFQNPAFERLWALSGSAREGALLSEFLPADLCAELITAYARVLLQDEPLLEERSQLVAGDGPEWVRHLAVSLGDGVAVTWYDVSERRRAEDKLRLQSPYDPVTGLLNAVTFSDRLEHCLRRARRGQRQFCLIKIDLQGVDALIERHGAPLVGQFLRLLSQQVQRALRESDTLAWFTTHSYGAILEDERNLPAGDGVARTLLKVISTPIEIEGQMLQVSANAGLTLWDNDKQTADDLIKEVQAAVKAARAGGRNQHAVYTPALATQQAR